MFATQPQEQGFDSGDVQKFQNVARENKEKNKKCQNETALQISGKFPYL
jgi:hypothetical protein